MSTIAQLRTLITDLATQAGLPIPHFKSKTRKPVLEAAYDDLATQVSAQYAPAPRPDDWVDSALAILAERPNSVTFTVSGKAGDVDDLPAFISSQIDNGRTRVGWLVRDADGKVSGYSTENVRTVADVNSIIDLAFSQAQKTSYPDTVTIDMFVPPTDEPLPDAIERSDSFNCVIGSILMAHFKKPEAVKRSLEEKLRSKFPGLFIPSAVGHDLISQIAKFTDYQLEFYSTLKQYCPDVAPWAVFNSSGKHRKVIRFIVDTGEGSAHARLDVGNSCSTIEYANHQTMRQLFKAHDVVHCSTDYHGSMTSMSLTIIRDGSLVCVKNEVTRPSLYTDLVNDEDRAFIHLYSPEDILGELFRRKFSIISSESRCYHAVISSEKFPRNTLFSRIDTDVVTVDHNRSFCAYESHPRYVGFPFSRIVTVAGDVPSSGDLRRAFVVLDSFTWKTDARSQIARLIYSATISPKASMLHHTQVMFDYLSPYADMVIHSSVLAAFSEVSVLGFIDEMTTGKNTKDLNKKALSCKLIGNLIRGGISNGTNVSFSTSHADCNRILYELNELASAEKINNYAHTVRENVVEFNFKKLGSTKSGYYHVHAFILDYSTTQTMTMFTEAYSAAPKEVVSICADAIRLTHSGWSTCKDLFNIGTEPGQWKTSITPLPEVYKSFSLFTDSNLSPKQTRVVDPHLTDHIFPSLPYEGSRVYISGPGGIGKTYGLLKSANSDLLMLFPTLELTKHAQISCNYSVKCKTLAWYLELCSIGSPPPFGVIAVDEVFLQSAESMKKFATAAASKVVYLIGDPVQVSNTVQAAFTPNHIGKSYTRIALKRGPISRHGVDFGNWLDSLRDMTDYQVLNSIKRNLPEFDGTYLPTDISVVPTHQIASWCNGRFANQHDCPLKQVRGKKGMDPDPELVWWDRQKMTDLVPKGFYFEPNHARTIHSLQGQTISNRLIIATELVKIRGALYTAVSRVTSIDLLCWQ